MGIFSMRSGNFKMKAEMEAPVDEVVEDTEVNPGTVPDKPASKEVSSMCLHYARRNVMFAILRSIGMYMLRSGSSKEECLKNLKAIVNSLIAGNDVAEEDRDYVTGNYLNSIVTDCSVGGDIYAAAYTMEYVDTYSIITGAIDYTDTFMWAFDHLDKSALEDHERAIIEGYQDAQKAYWEARNKYEEYFRAANKEAAIDLIRKYTTILGQANTKWLDGVSRSLGITVAAPAPKTVQDDANLVNE